MRILRRLRRYLGSPLLLSDLTATLADVYRDAPAVYLEGPDGDLRWSFRDLHLRTLRYAAAFAAAGLRPGERVAIAIGNGIDVLVLSFAVMRLGAVAVPLNAALQPAEFEAILSQSGARMIVLDRQVHQRTKGAETFGARILFYGPAAETPPGAVALESLVDAPAAPPVASNAAAVCLILFTSGTTGLPSGALHTSGGLLEPKKLALLFPPLRRDLVVVALPLAHVMGWVAVLLPWLAGVPVCALPEFHAAEVLRTLERRRASMFAGVPAMYKLMADAGLEGHDLTRMRAWISAADAMPPELVPAFRRAGAAWLRPAFFVDAYGSVELGGAAMARIWTSRSLAAPPPPAHMLPRCRAGIRTAEGAEVPRGDIGELWIRSPASFRGYLRAGENGEQGSDGGFVRTGDLARRGRAGTIILVSRDLERIKTGGYSVFAAEIERVLNAHPAVAVAVAFGLPDAVKGEVPAAVVALKPGADAATTELLDFARVRLVSYKAPRSLFIVAPEDILYTATRKIARAALAQRFAAVVPPSKCN